MNKKTITIIAISILATLGFAVVLFFVLTKKMPSDVAEPETADKKPVAIDFAQFLKEHADSYKKIELADMARTIDDCLLVGGQEVLPCAIRIASQEKNIGLCDRLQKDWQAVCQKEVRFNIAASSGNPGDCNNLEAGSRESCTKRYAADFKEVGQCDVFENYKQLCSDVLNHNVAIEKSEADKCDGISDSQLKNDCANIISNQPLDSDRDGLPDTIELIYKSSPFLEDTDGDGLSDYEELKKYSTKPGSKDSDGDGLSDKNETLLGSEPLKVDSDGDGFKDGDEVKNGFDPAGPGKLKQLK